MQCVDALFKNRNKSATKREFDNLSVDKKASLLTEFLSKKEVLQSLYDLMFIDRINRECEVLQSDSIGVRSSVNNY